ncbi:MAG: AMP-binding protein [Ruminococcus sp.]|nr:AMP-binding protein [Ruminococcus sp.]
MPTKNNFIIENPKLRIVEDLKIRNKDNMKVIAGEYFGSKFTYAQTFKMFEDYKKAFIAIDGFNEDTITISAPSTIASINAFYGALDANKIVNMTGPGFLHAYTEKYTTRLNSKTVVMFDGFLNDDLIAQFQTAGVKNLIVTSVTDYMNPLVKIIATKKGMISNKDFLDQYAKSHSSLPRGIEMIRLKDFAKLGSKIKQTYNFPYEENKLAAYFLTGATTSQYPKCVKISADGFTKMARIYDELWFDFKPADRNTIFIPLFYATGAVHGVHAGLMNGMTLIYKPKYDRFAFAKDLLESKANIALVAPSHVATLEESGLEDNALNKLKYIFIGGEAIMPAAMEKFRKTGDRLGIQYILNGYGMTETGSMSGISDKESKGDDVTVSPVPGVEYRIVDPITREILPDNVRGILEKKSPCATLGYFEEAKNKVLFTDDGWINTGDVAIRYSNGKYRIFGRETDCFTNSGITYAMYDIEEQALKHPDVAEAEVIKFNIRGEEYPAMVVVPNSNATNRIAKITKELCAIDIAGMQHFIGVRFVDKFKTHPVTSKRDYLSLQNDITGYYFIDTNNNAFVRDIGVEKISINKAEIKVTKV